MFRVFNLLEIQEAFQNFDENGDGHITEEELKDATKKSGEKQSADHAKDMIKDVDRSGKIFFLHTSQAANMTGAYPGYFSMRRLGMFILPPAWDASPLKGYTQH